MKKTILTVTFIILSIVFLVSGILIVKYTDFSLDAKVFIEIITIVLFLLFFFLACETERKAGIYVCKKCGTEFEINIKRYIFSPHIGRSRRLRCPKCGEKSYCKYKVKQI